MRGFVFACVFVLNMEFKADRGRARRWSRSGWGSGGRRVQKGGQVELYVSGRKPQNGWIAGRANEIAQETRCQAQMTAQERRRQCSDCHFPQPFPGAAKRKGWKKLVTQPLSTEIGRTETPTRRWFRTSYFSRAQWSPRSARYPSPGSGWAVPRSRPSSLKAPPMSAKQARQARGSCRR